MNSLGHVLDTRHLPTDTIGTLTDWEWRGLDVEMNLADAHARGLSRLVSDLTLDLDQLFAISGGRGQQEVERDFLEAFFSLAMQPSALELPPPLLHYACSISLDVLSKFLRATRRYRVCVVEPTFDNIPQLLQRHGLSLQPLDEATFDDQPGLAIALAGADALVLVTPNNPTGRGLTPAQLQGIAELCATTETLLVLDMSFRFFGDAAGWDQYAVLTGVRGLEFVCVEDTGKTWPLLEMKAGILVSSAPLAASLRRVTDELLLNVSPFILQVLTEVILAGQDGAGDAGGLGVIRGLVARNRAALRPRLEELGANVTLGGSESSVEWLELGHDRAVHTAQRLLARGVAVLPGSPFYWSRPHVGDRFVRLALYRDADYFDAALGRLLDAGGLAVHE
jgi:aspartate/methionine/tyrosine aminotransferase